MRRAHARGSSAAETRIDRRGRERAVARGQRDVQSRKRRGQRIGSRIQLSRVEIGVEHRHEIYVHRFSEPRRAFRAFTPRLGENGHDGEQRPHRRRRVGARSHPRFAGRIRRLRAVLVRLQGRQDSLVAHFVSSTHA